LVTAAVNLQLAQFSIRVTQGASGNIGNAVQIFLAVGVIELAAFAILDGEWVASAVCLS
jgi:hypothetical protein